MSRLAVTLLISATLPACAPELAPQRQVTAARQVSGPQGFTNPPSLTQSSFPRASSPSRTRHDELPGALPAPVSYEQGEVLTQEQEAAAALVAQAAVSYEDGEAPEGSEVATSPAASHPARN
jgi:hypothetical protein